MGTVSFGAGVAFQLFTQSDGDSGVYADAAARDVYFAANPADLERLNQNEFLIIKLLNDGAGNIAYQQRFDNDWLDVTSLVQGETGPAGLSGDSLFFDSSTARDDFFTTVGNEVLLTTFLPILVSKKRSVITQVWTGEDNPPTYESKFFQAGSSSLAPGSIILGDDGMALSSAARTVNLIDAYGATSIPLGTQFDATGNLTPFQYDFGVSSTQSVSDVFDTLLADPQSMQFSVVSNTMTSGYSIRPGTSGELRVQAFAGTAETDPVVLDQTFTILPGDIGNVVPIVLENKTLIENGDDLLLTFSDIQLNGGLQTSGTFNGQTVPYLDADFALLTRRDLVIQEGDTLDLKIPANNGSAFINFLDESDVIQGELRYSDALQNTRLSSQGSSVTFGTNMSFVTDGGLFVIGATGITQTVTTGDMLLNTPSGAIKFNDFIEVDTEGQSLNLTSDDVAGTPTISFHGSLDADLADIIFSEADSSLTINAAVGDLRLVTSVANIEILPGSGFTGVNTSNPSSTLHIFEDTALTGASVGLLIENAGLGDALAHFSLPTQEWTIGADSSESDGFSVSPGLTLAADPAFHITTGGNVGIGTSSPVSTAHLFENTTGVGSPVGLTIENAGTGDAITHFVVAAQNWTMGIDNSISDMFAIRASNTLGALSNLQILPSGEIGLNKTPRANHCLDIDTLVNTVVALYDQKDVTLEQGNFGNGSSTDFFFNRADVGFNQSEFYMFNDNNVTNTSRFFKLNYTDAGALGGLSIRRSDGTQSGQVGIGKELADTMLDVLSTLADTTPVMALETTGTNGARTEKGVGDQDPNGVRTGAGGDEHIVANGDVSGSYESLEATTGTEWYKRAVFPPGTEVINTAAEFEALATAGTITVAEPMTIILNVDVVTTTVFDITAGGDLNLISFNDSDFIYVGTGTAFTVTGTANVGGALLKVQNIDLLAASTGTWLDVTGGIDLALNATRVDLINASTTGGTLGSFQRGTGFPQGPVFIINHFTAINKLGGFVLSDTASIMGDVNLLNVAGSTSSDPFLEILSTTNQASGINFSGSVSNQGSGETFVRVDPGLNDASAVTIKGLNIDLLDGALGLFDTSGATGTFTAVADAAVAATAITSVSNVTDDIARFNFTVGPTMFVNQEVVISGFTTNTIYNQTALITAVGVGFFEVDYIAFGTDETGSFLSNSVTMTDTATTLVDGDTVKLATDGSTDYDSGAVVYNQLTNTFQVNKAFTVTQTGTWSQAGLDQTDTLVLADQNPQFVKSNYIATSFVNNNTTANGAIVNNTFTDMVFGTGGSALVEGSTIERWKLIDDVIGLFEYTGREPFDGFITFDFTVTSSGGSVDFRFKWVRDSNAVVSNSFISFADSNPDRIFNQFFDFLTAGFNVDDLIEVSGSASNDGTYTIAAVTADEITLVGSDTLVNESAGAAVTITALETDLADNVEALVNVGSNAQSITKTFPLRANTGDQIRPQITRNSGTSGITTSYATIFASQ